MKINKELIGALLIAITLGLWIFIWYGLLGGAIAGIGIFGYYLIRVAEEEKEKAPEKNPEFIPSCDKENDIHTFKAPKRGDLCQCCVRKWGG